MKYIFWDLETSTLNAAYGSIIQAAAICTDEDFNILDQFDLRGRMKKEYPVPSAKALLVKCAIIGSHNEPLHTNIYPKTAPNIRRGIKPKNCM